MGADYNPNQPDQYFYYLDANNLYGWAMQPYLPHSGFEWMDIDTNWSVTDDSDVSYILEEDFEYP